MRKNYDEDPLTIKLKGWFMCNSWIMWAVCGFVLCLAIIAFVLFIGQRMAYHAEFTKQQAEHNNIVEKYEIFLKKFNDKYCKDERLDK